MSRFLRRNKPDAAAAEEAASLPPATSELILRPSSESKVPAPAQLSEEQQAKLKELEEWTRELHASTLDSEDSYWKWEERWLAEDGLYARYLRAAKWDMANAKKRIQGTLEWRRSFKPDLIVPDEVKVEGETGKHIISGFDREGRPLLYLRPGRENTKPSERQIRYLVWSMERALDFLPPGQEKLCLVIDYKAATTSNNPSFSTSLKVLNILQNHYVERLGRAYVSSVPWFIVSVNFGTSPTTSDFRCPKLVLTTHSLLRGQERIFQRHRPLPRPGDQGQDPVQLGHDRLHSCRPAGLGVERRAVPLRVRL